MPVTLTRAQIATLRTAQDAYYTEEVDQGPERRARMQYQQVKRSETDGTYEIHIYDGPQGQGAILLEWRDTDTELRIEVMRGAERYREHEWDRLSAERLSGERLSEENPR